VLERIVPAGDLFVQELFPRVCPDSLEFRNSFDGIHGQTEAIDFIFDGQLQRRVDVALFLVAADVHVAVVRAAVRQSVDQPGIAVKIEDDRFVDSKQLIKISIGQAVGVLSVRLQLKEIDDIDVTNLQIREFLPQQNNRC